MRANRPLVASQPPRVQVPLARNAVGSLAQGSSLNTLEGGALVNPGCCKWLVALKMSESHNLPNLTIGYSLPRLFMLLGTGLVLTLLCAALAFNWHYVKDISTFQIALCYFGIVFFGLATCKMLWTLISSGEPVVFITRVGILDTRIADDTISWRSVRDISIFRYRNQKVVVLQLDPLLAARFDGGFLKRVLVLLN
jgi:hypothetical protein